MIWQLADELNPDKYEVYSEGRNNDDDFIIEDFLSFSKYMPFTD